MGPAEMFPNQIAEIGAGFWGRNYACDSVSFTEPLDLTTERLSRLRKDEAPAESARACL
jgi:hypothetical protein